MALAFCCRPIGLQRVICDLVTEQQPMCMQPEWRVHKLGGLKVLW